MTLFPKSFRSLVVINVLITSGHRSVVWSPLLLEGEFGGGNDFMSGPNGSGKPLFLFVAGVAAIYMRSKYSSNASRFSGGTESR
jgi:hypothetical protein